MSRLEDLKTTKQRTVWKHDSGSHLVTVTGLLEEGEYEISKEVREDGTITLTCTPVEATE